MQDPKSNLKEKEKPSILKDDLSSRKGPSSLVSIVQVVSDQSVTYPYCLGNQYTALGTQALAPNKHFLYFLFSVAFQQKKQSMILQRIELFRNDYKDKNAEWTEKMRQKDVKENKEIAYKLASIHFSTY